jgi:hypothetical protein
MLKNTSHHYVEIDDVVSLVSHQFDQKLKHLQDLMKIEALSAKVA